jgi:glycine/serine hydroxymethyltransferase
MVGGFTLVSGGTGNHLISSTSAIKYAERKLSRALTVRGWSATITIPNDPAKPSIPADFGSVLRPTSRGMKEPQMDQIAEFINRVTNHGDETMIRKVRQEVTEFCKSFPLPDTFVRPIV